MSVTFPWASQHPAISHSIGPEPAGGNWVAGGGAWGWPHTLTGPAGRGGCAVAGPALTWSGCALAISAALTGAADSSDTRVASAASAPVHLNTGEFMSGDTGPEELTLLRMLDDDGRWMAGNRGSERCGDA